MIDVSIIIVTWNAGKFIKDCLDSVFGQDLQNYEVIVVDNNSSDASLEIIRAYLPKLELIENKKNEGFCLANNQGISRAKGKYLFTLNSDIVLEKDYIRRLKDYLSQNSKLGMAQGRILRMDRKTVDTLGLCLSRTRRLFNVADGTADSSRYDQVQEIFGPCAAAALYKRELLNDIKIEDEYFDNDFFFLVEDFDIAWRARNKGWRAIYVPSARCYHYRHSSEHNLLFKQYLSFRNRYFMLIKNENWKTALLGAPYFFIYDLPRLFFLLLTNPYIPKAVVEIFAALPKLFKKRRSLC